MADVMNATDFVISLEQTERLMHEVADRMDAAASQIRSSVKGNAPLQRRLGHNTNSVSHVRHDIERRKAYLNAHIDQILSRLPA